MVRILALEYSVISVRRSLRCMEIPNIFGTRYMRRLWIPGTVNKLESQGTMPLILEVLWGYPVQAIPWEVRVPRGYGTEPQSVLTTYSTCLNVFFTSHRVSIRLFVVPSHPHLHRQRTAQLRCHALSDRPQQPENTTTTRETGKWFLFSRSGTKTQGDRCEEKKNRHKPVYLRDTG